MQPIRMMMRRVIVAGVMASGVLLLPGSATGQLARRVSNERLLILTPVPTGVDTAFAVETGEALRARMISRYRMRIAVIPTTTICEALEASGFNCKIPLPSENAPALARFLQATAYMVGWIDKTGDSLRLRLRLVDAAGSGLAGWETIRAPATTTAEDFGKLAADNLDNQLKAAEFARDCTERRQRSDGKGAADRAERAFALYPNHPAAAMCLAYAFEVQQQPIDSIVSALRRAVAGDSLNGNAWEELGRRLRDKGDTAEALAAFRNQLRADPTDERLRLGVAAGLTAAGEYDDAVEVLDEGLVRNAGNLTMLQLKERACLDGTLWACALEALEGQFDLDSSLAHDTIFFTKTFAAAQSVPDTTAMLRWSERAVTEFPDYIAAWRARAATLKLVNDRDRVLEAYDRIVALDSAQIGSALALAQYLLDSTLVIDTAVSLDTARLLKAEQLLMLAGRTATDTATSMAIATMFYNPASKISQLRMTPHLPLAARFLEHTLEFDKRGQLNELANFFLGLALFFQITELDQRVRETESCELVDVEVDMTARARAALEAGRQISPATVGQLLGFVQQIQGALPTYKPAFKCPGA
ncbi:MAG: tetratricopeptide repeat protein [Gemmatimonadota bacterium]|nr:tetratricopeptide repeat protein [Gemmatimonadota bacterium]